MTIRGYSAWQNTWSLLQHIIFFKFRVGGTWGHGLTSDWSYCRCRSSGSSRGPSPSSLRQRWDSRTDWRRRRRRRERQHTARLHTVLNTHTHTHSIWLWMKSGSAVSNSSSEWIMDFKWPTLWWLHFGLLTDTLWLVYRLKVWLAYWLTGLQLLELHFHGISGDFASQLHGAPQLLTVSQQLQKRWCRLDGQSFT